MRKSIRKLFLYIPIPTFIIFLLGLLAVSVSIAYSHSAKFADYLNFGLSANLRFFFAKLTGWLPFSLAELIVFISPVLLFSIIHICCKQAEKSRTAFIRCLLSILAAPILFYTGFVFIFGAGYKTTPLEERLNLERRDVSPEELCETLEIVVEKLNELEKDILYLDNQGSIRPYSHAESVHLCCQSYESLSAEYPFLPVMYTPVKQLFSSEWMTYTHISGMYTFFTGEANLNTNYPYFVNVYTSAHELAHQRGIAREDEANFMAYLVCISSDDKFMQYAGYLNMYEYLASPLYKTSKELYNKVVSNLHPNVKNDLVCYSRFFDKYRNNTAATVSDKVNNTYLTLQGTPGTKSYGMVVDLAVAYHLSKSHSDTGEH